jgi:hypothetical protein
MITRGFWCDECRVKYVRHVCRNHREVKTGAMGDSDILARRLPCGHSWEQAIAVECQAFANSGEHLWMEWGPVGSLSRAEVWIVSGDRQRGRFVGNAAWQFWGLRVRQGVYKEPEWEMWVGEWLASKPDAIVRAYMNRWESSKYVPDWVGFREHQDAKRACALVVRKAR